LAFALGFNLSISRLGSVFNGNIVPVVYSSSGLGIALLVGFIVCIASFAAAIGLALLDKYADKVDGTNKKLITEEDKFKLKDLTTFTLEFWLICASCVFTYMAILPPMQVLTDLLETKYKVST
jgi:hypothetical protein